MLFHVQALSLAASSGLTAHLGIFKRGEWHLQAPVILSVHLLLALSAVGIVYVCTDATQNGLRFRLTSEIFFSYLSALFGSIVCCRRFLHPLQHFQGPHLASATKLWHVWHILDSKNFQYLDKLHHQYGRFVRTGPNEITTCHPVVIECLDAPKNHTTKPDWYDILHPRTSAIFTRSDAEHGARRKLWSHALSSHSISDYLPRVMRHVKSLAEYVEAHQNRPVLLNNMMAWFSFDSMGDFLFNEDFGMLKSTRWHPAIVQQHNALALLAPMNETVWLVRLVLSLAPFFGKAREWFKAVEFCDKQMQYRLKRTRAKEKDITSYFIKDFHASSNDQTLQQRQNLLSGNAISTIVAGSDTTSPALTCTFYLLAKHPGQLSKVFDEVASVDCKDANCLATLPHLNAVINESLRLFPPAMTWNARLAPPEGLWIGDTHIPGGTKVVASKYVIMRLEEAFDKADAFIPERWTTRPEMVRQRAAFAPFGIGHRQCISKGLAQTQIRLVIATVVKHYNFEFPPGFEALDVERDMKDQIVCRPGQCWVVLKKRPAGEH